MLLYWGILCKKDGTEGLLSQVISIYTDKGYDSIILLAEIYPFYQYLSLIHISEPTRH